MLNRFCWEGITTAFCELKYVSPVVTSRRAIGWKAIIILTLLFFQFVSYADESDVRREVVEDKDKNGNILSRIEKLFREGALIMETDYQPSSNGTMIVSCRNFYVNGDIVMTEAKSNPDNANLDILTFYRLNTNSAGSHVEMFTRQTDGFVKPVSTQELKDFEKKLNVSIAAFAVFGNSATNRVKDTIVSPDNKLKAIVFSRDYGALGSFNRQVVVVENSQSSFRYDADKILMSVTADGNASQYLSEVNAFWTSTNELHIRYPIGGLSGPRLVRTNSPDQAIKVVYENFDVK